jgi:acyl carrier protein
MIPKANDSLDIVEAVMALEEMLGVEFPGHDAVHVGSRREMVDWLERCLFNQWHNANSVALLLRLAETQNNPALAEGLDGTWRREQIDAIVREIFRE